MIRQILLYSAAIFMAIVVQATVFHSVFPSIVAPDLVLILVFMLGLSTKNPRGAAGAFTLGLVADFASARFAGPNAAGCVAAYCFVVFCSSHVFAERGAASGVIAAGASAVKSLVYGALLAFYAGVFPTVSDLRTLAVEAVLTGLLTPVLIAIFEGRFTLRGANVRGKVVTRGVVR